ncbi:MAG: YdeI family protein [Dehalococcoidia bacterium]
MGVPSTHRDGRPLFLAETREEWRGWLDANHRAASGVWLVSYKRQTGRPFVPYPETVEEALCFGWIDSRPNAVDAERAMRLFTPRNPKSPWSRINKSKVERLLAGGLMRPAGIEVIEAARRNGAWTVYDEIEDLLIPDDLSAALARAPLAAHYFTRFPDSSKKNILWWIKSAGTAATRARRVEETAHLALDNRMANHVRGRDAGPRETEPTPRPSH